MGSIIIGIILVAVLISMVPFWLVRVYQCAHKITAVNGLALTLDNGSTVLVPQEYLNRYNPVVGGYYIVAVGGVEGYLSAAQFEQGYVVVES